MEQEDVLMFFISFTLLISLITMFAGCLCCRRKIPKNELLGLEGMVKIKNPDDNVINSNSVVSIDPKASIGDADTKRSSNAPHRSLPAIPISTEPNGDTCSDLYATVGDKMQILQEEDMMSPNESMKKQVSVSQHSSISQADDISSPYARVKSPPHSYDKVRHAEHPYAQLNAGTSSTIQIVHEDEVLTENTISRRASNQSLLPVQESVQEIPAASAIAGFVAASQELPYMTPPIVQQPQNFSGDSQDSSKGYTSISVREPLANILAQTIQQNAQQRRRELNDYGHYATVSDDSDEMYAAIDDPNNQGDLYTSGSETYAQIQPPTALTVSVEINPIPNSMRNSTINSMRNSTIDESVIAAAVTSPRLSTASSQKDVEFSATVQQPVVVVENLKNNMHSRQASSSSVTSSVGNLGSPKPEKRQANSPLPPTPKTSLQSNLSNSNLTSSSSIPSGRNSSASVIEINLHEINNEKSDSNDGNGAKKKQSPSKDLEGMYAKVMKKNKLSHFPSQNTSPVLARKSSEFEQVVTISKELIFTSDPDISKDVVISTSPIKNQPIILTDNNYETIDKKRNRSNSFDNKDPGYETIPGDAKNNNLNNNRLSGDYAQIMLKARSSAPAGILAEGIHRVSQNTLEIFNEVEKCNTTEPGYESLPDKSIIPLNDDDPGYEVVKVTGSKKTSQGSDYDPNYEILRPADISDDGYAKVLEKRTDIDGYSSIKSLKREQKQLQLQSEGIDSVDGYSSIGEKKNHGYAKIKEMNINMTINNNLEGEVDEEGSDIYTSIPHSQETAFLSIQDTSHNYSTISEIQQIKPEIQTLNVSDNSPGGYSVISETHTTPSTESNSSGTQLGYNSIKNSKNNISSNYESLTESESDPNYESVKYNINSIENPYERLHNEKSVTPEKINDISEMGPNLNNSNTSTSFTSTSTNKTSDSLEVGDYFQV